MIVIIIRPCERKIMKYNSTKLVLQRCSDYYYYNSVMATVKFSNDMTIMDGTTVEVPATSKSDVRSWKGT